MFCVPVMDNLFWDFVLGRHILSCVVYCHDVAILSYCPPSFNTRYVLFALG